MHKWIFCSGSTRRSVLKASQLPGLVGMVLCMLLLVGGWPALRAQQPQDNSPYSRLGLGELDEGFFTHQQAMGGLSAAYYHPLYLNQQNPASYAFLRATAFESSLYGKYARIKSATEEGVAEAWAGNISRLALGFPLRNPLNEARERRPYDWHGGMGLGLQPYTKMDYNVLSTRESEYDTTLNYFVGAGSTNLLYWGGALRYKDFSLGLKFGYLFGQLEYTRSVIFQGIGLAYSDDFSDELTITGWYGEAGLMYRHRFRNEEGEKSGDRMLVAGLTAKPSTSFGTRSTKVYRTVNPVNPNIADTVLYEQGLKEEGRLPARWSVGAMYIEKNKWRVGVEYSMERWSQYVNPPKQEALVDAYRFSVGAEYVPDYASYNNYLKRVRYRAGFFHRKDPRSISTTLTETGITMGAAFPIILARQQTSFIHLALGASRFGHPQTLQETRLRLSVGFTLNDNTWFYKRKFE